MAKKPKVMSGNEALATAAIAVGCRFYGGYPITPSSEIAEYMAKHLPEVGGKFIQMEDEIASMASIIGGSLAGAKSMTASSGPGISLKQENLGFACIAEVPCVVVNVMRGGPSTGQPTFPSQSDVMQAKWGTHGDHPIIALAPAYLREIYLTTIEAFNLSEKYRTPVYLLLDEVIGHLKGNIDIPEPSEYKVFNRVRPDLKDGEKYYPYDSSKGDIPPMFNYFDGHPFHVTGLNHDKTGFPTTSFAATESEERRMQRKIDDNVDDIVKYVEVEMADAEICVFSFGVSGMAAEEMVLEARKNGMKVGLFRAITLWPFPVKQIKEIASRVKAVVVAELNLGQMINEVERVVAGKCAVVGVNRVDGQIIMPDQILAKVKEVI